MPDPPGSLRGAVSIGGIVGIVAATPFMFLLGSTAQSWDECRRDLADVRAEVSKVVYRGPGHPTDPPVARGGGGVRVTLTTVFRV